MRPIGPPGRAARTRLTRRSDLRPIVLRMIALNSLSAFTAEVSRSQAATQVRAAGTPQTLSPLTDTPRRLDAVPAPPAGPLPRGSLLDLKV